MPTGIANELSMFATWWLMVVAAFNRLPTSPCGYQYDCLHHHQHESKANWGCKGEGDGEGAHQAVLSALLPSERAPVMEGDRHTRENRRTDMTCSDGIWPAWHTPRTNITIHPADADPVTASTVGNAIKQTAVPHTTVKKPTPPPYVCASEPITDCKGVYPSHYRRQH